MSQALVNLVPLLDGSNYKAWARAMESYLKSMDLWEIISRDEPWPTFVNPAHHTVAEDTAMAAWTKISNHVMGNIMLRCTPSIQDKIQDEDAPMAWDTLKIEYGTVGPTTIF